MAKFTVKVDQKTGQNYLPRHVREDGFVGKVEGLMDAITLVFIKPGASLADVAKSLRILQADIALRRQQERSPVGKQSPLACRADTAKLTKCEKPQHPVFSRYTRDWLHQVTGFSKGYLCRVATGESRLSRSFIERVCYKLQMPEEELFLPEAAEAHSAPSQPDK